MTGNLAANVRHDNLETTNDAGFSLIETLVALLLLAVVLAMTPPAFDLARRIAGVGPQLERAATTATAQETLARQLSAALPLKSVDDAGRLLSPLVGGAQRLAFIAPPPLSAPAAGLQRYEIALAPGTPASETDLVLRSSPFLPPTAQRFGPSPTATTVLVERASSLGFRYFGPPLPPNTGGDIWHSEWDRPTLPTLVEIVFETAGPSGRTERHVLLIELKVARTR
jgi:prepilin-type N-terminal cleavage/methylation domain-containing protein